MILIVIFFCSRSAAPWELETGEVYLHNPEPRRDWCRPCWVMSNCTVCRWTFGYVFRIHWIFLVGALAHKKREPEGSL